ncbi:hypothetical protein C8Q76DRAFT_862075 [Earliella scabrosa]|nr:hypothetical protein C8Q76DRAFT_862075 [Earliella scabrosa]
MPDRPLPPRDRPVRDLGRHRTMRSFSLGLLLVSSDIFSSAPSSFKLYLPACRSLQPSRRARYREPQTVDTITDLPNQTMKHGHTLSPLQPQVFAMAGDSDILIREAAFRVFAGCPNFIIDLNTDGVVRASRTHRAPSHLDLAQQAHVLALMHPILNTLPSLLRAQQPPFIFVLTELATSNPHLFRLTFPPFSHSFPHFLVSLLSADSTFAFPPVAQSSNGDECEGTGEEDEVRKAALEFMITLSESEPAMLKGVERWVNIIVRGCLEGMGEIPEDDTKTWLDAHVDLTFLRHSPAFALLTTSQPANDPKDDSYPHTYEHSLDRVACALASQAILTPPFSFIPAMLTKDCDMRVSQLSL